MLGIFLALYQPTRAGLNLLPIEVVGQKNIASIVSAVTYQQHNDLGKQISAVWANIL